MTWLEIAWNGQWSCTAPTIEFSEVGSYDTTGHYRPASYRYGGLPPSERSMREQFS